MARCRDMAIGYSTYHKECIWEPHFGGRGGHMESSIVPSDLKEWCWFPIGCPLWPFCRNLQSNVCDAQVNRGWGRFGSKFRGVPFGVDPWCCGYAESEHPGLTNFRRIPTSRMWLLITNKIESFNATAIFTARCTLVQSVELRSHVVCPSVCDVGELWSHRLEFFENNFTIS